MRILLVLLLILASVAGAAWINAGYADGPVIEISGSGLVGQIGEVIVAIDAPEAAFKRIEVRLEQGDRVTELFSARASVREGTIDVPEPGTSGPSAEGGLSREAQLKPMRACRSPLRREFRRLDVQALAQLAQQVISRTS